MEDFDVNLDDLPDELSFDDINENKHEVLTKKSTQKELIGTREYKAKIKYQQLITSRAKSFNDIVSLDLIENTQYRIVTSMSFNAITVIQYLLKYYQIIEMSIAVFRMNNKAFDYLKEFIQKDDIPSNILVSIFFSNNKKYERWAKELTDLGRNQTNVNVGYGNTHTQKYLSVKQNVASILFLKDQETLPIMKD
ncbi:hypothetical protein KAR91_56255 [Candidatus Pacearchaeota archaeon]|nr:hypothetical protein [Candidatus Pacearchaeota archaeon]